MTPVETCTAGIGRARVLRREMTAGEKRLWSELRQLRRLHGIHVRRQAPIGPYVVDFVVHAHRLVIEVDGHFHEEAERKVKDIKRDQWLGEAGYRVIRIRTGDLDSAFDGCIVELLAKLGVQ